MTQDRAIEITKLIYCNDCQDEEECEDCIHGLAIEALKKQSIYEQIKWERDAAIEQLESIGVGLGRKMDDVKEAIEKQIPKKVITEKGETFALTKDGKESYLFRYRCPSCNRIIRFFEANCFCMFCGQAVDWSEEE